MHHHIAGAHLGKFLGGGGGGGGGGGQKYVRRHFVGACV